MLSILKHFPSHGATNSARCTSETTQNFAGAGSVLAVNSLMSKRGLLLVVGSLSLCLSVSAQQVRRADIFKSLNNSSPHLPSLALADAGSFSFASAFSWTGPATVDFLPSLPTVRPPAHQTSNSTALAADSSREVAEIKPNLLDYTSGEVGFFYGRSMGKSGGSYKEGYVVGEVGDDRFHITVGAAYEDSSFRFARPVR